jgi:hypothetical protein
VTDAGITCGRILGKGWLFYLGVNLWQLVAMNKPKKRLEGINRVEEKNKGLAKTI